ncbi:MAG: hypothetical protein V3V41_10415 [Candidatus Heimdallarchaeota archaeon]
MNSKLKKSILLPIIALIIIGICVGGFFLVSEFVINNNEKILLKDVILPEVIEKGEDLEISLQMEVRRSNVFVLNINLGISSEEYNLNNKTTLEINRLIDKKGEINLTVTLGPLINTSTGFFALNVGEYRIISIDIVFDGRIPKFSKEIDKIFQVINPISEEQIKNGDFEDGINEWTIDKADSNIELNIVETNPVVSNRLHVINLIPIQPQNTSWASINQIVNLTKSHYFTFDLEIIGNNCSVEIKILMNDEPVNMSLFVNENSTKTQLIYYGEAIGETEISVYIRIIYAQIATDIYLDNLSIIQYEHVVYVVMLNDNWEMKGGDIVRKNLFVTLSEVSEYFERNLGIKLIPLIELNWHPDNTSISAVNLIGLEEAGERLNLEGEWEVSNGRSSKNHGFDLLSCFSNQTSDHFGFAYYEKNAAFHFAQSEELREYSWLTIIEDWAENLVQHEISHNFGAWDRDRTLFPSSVMSKPSTPEQVVSDFTSSKLWLQVNNWLLDDALFMLKNRAMFD